MNLDPSGMAICVFVEAGIIGDDGWNIDVMLCSRPSATTFLWMKEWDPGGVVQMTFTLPAFPSWPMRGAATCSWTRGERR